MASVSQAIGGFFTLPCCFVDIDTLLRRYSDAYSSQEGIHLFLLPWNFVPIATNVHGKKLNICFGIPSFWRMFVGILTIVCHNYEDVNKRNNIKYLGWLHVATWFRRCFHEYLVRGYSDKKSSMKNIVFLHGKWDKYVWK